MTTTIRTWTTRLAIVAVLLYGMPLSMLAADASARLEGLVIGPDGRRAQGATVYLFDGEGVTKASAVADADGVYSLRDVPAGRYGMGVETTTGVVAPVASPPIDLGRGQLARRDLKLVQADESTVDQALTANYGFGSWFGSLGAGGKAGVIVGFVALAYLIYEAFDDEDPAPAPGSPVMPLPQ
jgi:hypothetical protein